MTFQRLRRVCITSFVLACLNTLVCVAIIAFHDGSPQQTFNPATDRQAIKILHQAYTQVSETPAFLREANSLSDLYAMFPEEAKLVNVPSESPALTRTDHDPVVCFWYIEKSRTLIVVGYEKTLRPSKDPSGPLPKEWESEDEFSVAQLMMLKPVIAKRYDLNVLAQNVNEDILFNSFLNGSSLLLPKREYVGLHGINPQMLSVVAKMLKTEPFKPVSRKQAVLIGTVTNAIFIASFVLSFLFLRHRYNKKVKTACERTTVSWKEFRFQLRHIFKGISFEPIRAKVALSIANQRAQEHQQGQLEGNLRVLDDKILQLVESLGSDAVADIEVTIQAALGVGPSRLQKETLIAQLSERQIRKSEKDDTRRQRERQVATIFAEFQAIPPKDLNPSAQTLLLQAQSQADIFQKFELLKQAKTVQGRKSK